MFRKLLHQSTIAIAIQSTNLSTMKSLIIGIVLMLATSATFDCRKVDWEVYYESMNLGCQYHFVHHLVPIRQAIGKYLNITLVPYGYANHTQHGVSCPHGPRECYGNAVHACVLDMYNFDKAFKYIKCMFESGYKNPPKVARKCARYMGLNFHRIDTCVQGSKGRRLIEKMAKKTNSLHPPKWYIPWDVINGRHVDADVDFLRYICDRFLRNVPACQY